MTSRKWTLFKERVQSFFEEVQRTSAKKRPWIKVVRSDKYHDFIKYVMRAKQLDTQYKLMVCLQLSLGARVSEILNTKKDDFIFRPDGTVGVKIVVLKKKHTVLRIGDVDSQMIPCLAAALEGIGNTDFLFNIKRNAVGKQYKIMMGITTHGLRHSCINYFYDILDYKTEDVVNIWQFSNWRTALRYHNSNPNRQSQDIAARRKLAKAG